MQDCRLPLWLIQDSDGHPHAPAHDLESLSVERAAARPQDPSDAQHHSLRRHAWSTVRSNCVWLQALWRDLLCVGFARQCWKVYRHDVPKVCPIPFLGLLLCGCLQHSVRPPLYFNMLRSV